MDRKKYKIWQKIISIVLTLAFLLQPVVFGFGVLAEGELTPTPTPEPTQASELSEPTQAPETTPEPTAEPLNTQIEPTATPIVSAANEDTSGVNEANASDGQTTTVTNNNDAQVVNDINAVSNTGDNEINPSPTATPELNQENVSVTPTPEESVTSTENSADPTPTLELLPTSGISLPTGTPEQGAGLSETGSESSSTQAEVTLEPSPSPEIIPTPGTLAENTDTGDGSQNNSLCMSQAETSVTNNNDANIDNNVTGDATSGQNAVTGEESKIETGDTSVEANLANVANLNVVGQDFWAAVFNLLGINNGDLDFSSVDIQNQFSQAIATVIAQNLLTGDGSMNISAADFLQSLMVVNNNTANVTNTVDLAAVSGQNSVVGEDGQILTGDSSVTVNLFNLINTNIVGTNFWFSVFNIFGDQNGDLILPYELQFLYGGDEGVDGNVAAANQGTGEGSQNLADAANNSTTTVDNNNGALVNNNVDVLADTGTNVAQGEDSAKINTGDASAKVDIRNFVNTNIFGGKFVFLLINVFGHWQGMLLNWWGSTTSDGQSVLAVGQLPPSPQPGADGTSALNNSTGDSSQNTADAASGTSLGVTNNNQATLTNEIKGQAVSGQNTAEGDAASIKTGNASVIANIANFVNTNIVGNNFFFAIINIFGNFAGNIFFPRPDLELGKSVDKSTAAPGENLSYSISYRNSGRVWAKDVVITDSLPAGINFVSASDGGVFEGGKVVWKIAKVNPGEAGSFSVTININGGLANGTQLINQALISTSTDEPNKSNNQGSAQTTINANPSGSTGENGNGTGGSSNGGFGGGSAGTCSPAEAPKAPTLLSAVAISGTEVKLSWAQVEKASYYLVAYGLESGNYLYGSPNVGNVSSYVIGDLTPGKAYYFVVAGVNDNGCPAAGPFSNELNNFGYGVLGAQEALAAEGEIEEGVSTEMGEVAGANTPACPWWWIVLGGEALFLAGFFGLALLKGKSLKYWWLAAPSAALLAFLGDKIAHNWFLPSQYCQYVSWGGLAIGGIESIIYKFIKKGGPA